MGGRPVTLVLLPGMDGTGDLFDPFVRCLPEWIKPIIISYPTDRPLDYSGHLDLAMAALPMEEPFVILGESFSGPLALMAAARNPAGLRGVILCATFVSCPLIVPAPLALASIDAGIFRLKSASIIKRLIVGKKSNNNLHTIFSDAIDKVHPDVLAARARAATTVDCRGELRDCPVPVLALVAGKDRIVSRRCADEMRAIRPDVRVARIDSPHLILQCATKSALLEIETFINSLDRGDITA